MHTSPASTSAAASSGLPRAASSPAAWRIWAALGTVYVLWGSTYLGIRIMVESIPALLSGSIRFLLAGVLLVGFAAARGAFRPGPSRRQLLAAAAGGVVLIGGGNGGVMLAEQTMASGPTALLISSTALFIAVISLIVFREWAPLRTWAGILIGLAGLAMLVGVTGSTPVTPAGGALALLAAAFWAAGSVWTSRVHGPANAALNSGVQMLAGGVALGVGALAAGELGRVHAHAVGWRPLVALVYLVIFGSLIGFSAYSWLLRKAPISLVSTYAYVNPVVAVILGAVVLAEPVTMHELIGGAVVLAAVALIVGGSGGSRRRNARQAEPGRA